MYRIMLVDDEENVLSALLGNLSHLRYELEAFSQPGKALARAGEVSFDLVISDYRMPSMDGVTLVKELKKIQPNIVAIMLSGFADLRSILSTTKEAEIYRYLTKPLEAEKLNTAIIQALEQFARKGDEQALPIRSQPELKGALMALEAKYPGITKPESDWRPA